MASRDERKRDRNDRGDRRREGDDRRKESDRRRDGDRSRDERKDHRSRDNKDRRDRRDDERRGDRDDRRRDETRRDKRRSPSPGGRKRGPPGGSSGPRNLRIDRHECRKAAIEFLIRNIDISDRYSNDQIEDRIDDFIRTLEMEYDYYGFTVEILRNLLLDRKYIVITDRWVMGILDEHLQAELKVPDLTILRVAGYELLMHPEIPTTVVIGEVNVLAKLYCPEKQSLIHAAVNRMIETQTSIGAELAAESGAGRKKAKDDPMALLVGLDQESQLAILLLEQMLRKKKREERRRSRSSSSSVSSRSPSPKRTRPTSPNAPMAPTAPMEDRDEPTKAPSGTGGIKLTFGPTNKPHVRIF